MTSEFVALPATETAACAIDAIRELDDDFESIYYVYTLDPAGALTGVLSLRTLIVADRDARLSDLAYRDVVWVAPDVDQEDVADEMAKYDLVAVPVCDENRHVLGIVTVDDALDVIAEEHEEDLQIAGVGASESGSGDCLGRYRRGARCGGRCERIRDLPHVRDAGGAARGGPCGVVRAQLLPGV